MKSFLSPVKSGLKIGALSAVVFAYSQAFATVSAFLEYTYPEDHLQSGDTCLSKIKMVAVLGIPAASAQLGTFSPTQVLNQVMGGPSTYVDTNVLTAGVPAAKRLVATYISDAYPPGAVEYTMKIDATALSSYYGATTAGRTKTIRSAKLALLSMAENMDFISGGSYRLKVNFTGLPSQAGLPGTALNATTVYPYSASSPLLSAYKSELINVNGSCN